jgi:hypothetical protein
MAMLIRAAQHPHAVGRLGFFQTEAVQDTTPPSANHHSRFGLSIPSNPRAVSNGCANHPPTGSLAHVREGERLPGSPRALRGGRLEREGC